MKIDTNLERIKENKEGFKLGTVKYGRKKHDNK